MPDLRTAVMDTRGGWRMADQFVRPSSRRRMAEMIELGPYVAQHLFSLETEFTIRRRATTPEWQAVANVNEVIDEYGHA